MNKDSKLKTYNYYPESLEELRSLIEELLEELGPDADLNDIDVSKINNFYNVYIYEGLFEHLEPRNIKIDQWNVSNVKNMMRTFYNCDDFNSDLSKWNVSEVRFILSN